MHLVTGKVGSPKATNSCNALIVSSISSKDGFSPGLTACCPRQVAGRPPPLRMTRVGRRPPMMSPAPRCAAHTLLPHDPAPPPDYLILTARARDVAVESALEPAKNRSRRLHNKVL